MTADDRTRVGLVGVNERARRLLLPGLAASPRAQVAAVCSRDRAKAKAAAAHTGPDARAFTSVEEMVGSGAVDAVFVNTPAATHYDLCLAAIQAGCAVICEKPLTTTTREAVALHQAATRAGVPTAVNFTYRSVLGYRLTERLLLAHGLGRPLHGQFALLQGHNFFPAFPRASALLDSGAHLFDTLASLCELAQFGRVTQVSATPMADGAAPDHGWGFTARTLGGAVVSAAFSRSALGWQNGLQWSLYGHDQAIGVELDSDRTDVRVAHRADGRDQGLWRSVPIPPDLQADDSRFPAYHLDRLVGAVRGEEPFPGFAAAVAAHRFAAALDASAAAEGWVDIEA